MHAWFRSAGVLGILGMVVAGSSLMMTAGCSGKAQLSLNTPPPAPAPEPPKDEDGDGIPSPDDKCPDKKEDGKKPDPKDGCPSDDPDEDGIVGDADKCPDKPETKNGYQDEDGCPDEAPPPSPVQVTADKINISEQIKFKVGSAEVDPASDKLIETIAKVIKDNPDVEYVEIAGHADKRGNAVGNKQLSQHRVEAVMKHLVEDGVTKDRLRAVGYGSYCPVDAADNEDAYAKNRRVEFIILKRGGKLLEAKWGGCAEAEKKGMKPAAVPANAGAAKTDAKADHKAEPKKK